MVFRIIRHPARLGASAVVDLLRHPNPVRFWAAPASGGAEGRVTAGFPEGARIVFAPAEWSMFLSRCLEWEGLRHDVRERWGRPGCARMLPVQA